MGSNKYMLTRIKSRHKYSMTLNSRKLRYNEVKIIRNAWLTEQNRQCLLCNELINPEEAVLDHNHKTGTIRGVLHRGCNALLGKIENNLARNKITPLRLANILANAARYIERTSHLRHPTHCTPEERGAKRKLKKKP